MLFNGVYEVKEHANGDLILKWKKIYADEYTAEHLDNGNIHLTKKQITMVTQLDELKLYDFTDSTIYSAKLSDTHLSILSYKTICWNIYNVINNGFRIIKNTCLNVQTLKKKNEGFKYFPALGISAQSTDPNTFICEIVGQCLANRVHVVIKIVLANSSKICVSV